MVLFQGFICKCATHFSPPVKKYKTIAHFEKPIGKRFSGGFVKGKGDREKRIIALGFAGSKGRNQSLLQTSSNLLQWLQVWRFNC